MSSTDAREQAGQPVVPEQVAPGGEQPGGHAIPAWRAGYRRRRRGWVAVVVAVVVVLAAGLGGADAAGVFRFPKSAVSNSGYATGTVAVRRGSLTEQTQESGVLGSAGSYSVVAPGSSGAGAGTFTWLPQAGDIIGQGQALYDVNETPVALLYGSVPAYQDLSEGMTGGDIRELNADLVKLGCATSAALGPRSGWDYFSSDTAYALGLLQSRLGLTVTGSLPLGQMVFLPSAIRVTGLGAEAVPGGPAAPGAVVLTGSSLSPAVTVSLDASMETEVAVGSKVAVSLPDGAVTPGVVSQVSTVAASSSPSSGNSGNGGSGNGSPAPATITVLVSLTAPAAVGHLSQVPVEVTITTRAVSNVLIVPVDALLARPGGGYAVEVTGPGGHHLVSATPGLFDDAAGTVQVTGNLTPGQRVVVPGI
jgi:hypothetical protein